MTGLMRWKKSRVERLERMTGIPLCSAISRNREGTSWPLVMKTAGISCENSRSS